jgi:uncharacterized phage protein (TIGR01671 family)
MNRIPNYRVWHKIEKRFVDLRSIDFELDNIGYDCQGEANYYDVAKFDEIVFQQWTGEYDKNKKEIYEGDIIRSYSKEFINDNYEAEVVFLDAAFHSKINEKEYAGLWSGDDIEVIGNIFEHSELLKNE